eukprot:752172-Hanusia_phi.AAC.4
MRASSEGTRALAEEESQSRNSESKQVSEDRSRLSTSFISGWLKSEWWSRSQLLVDAALVK